MDLHALARQLLILARAVSCLHVGTGLRLGVGLGHTVPKRCGCLPGVAPFHGGHVVLFKPDAGMLAKRREHGVVLGFIRGLLHLLGHQLRIEVQVQAEAIACFVVDGRDGGDDGVASVLALGPVDGVVLPVHAKIQPLDRHAGQFGFSRRQILLALPVYEINFAVEGVGADLGHFADATQWHLVHQQLEDQLVLVALALTQRARLRGREGLLAGVAPPTGRARLGGAERRVEGLAGGHAKTVIGTGLVGAAGLPHAGHAVVLDALQLLVDAEVALHGEQRAAQAARQMGVAFSSAGYLVSGLGVLRPLSHAADLGLAEVAACGVFAEVDLDAAMLWRYACRCDLVLLNRVGCDDHVKRVDGVGWKLPRGWGRFLGQESACIKRKSTS